MKSLKNQFLFSWPVAQIPEVVFERPSMTMRENTLYRIQDHLSLLLSAVLTFCLFLHLNLLCMHQSDMGIKPTASLNVMGDCWVPFFLFFLFIIKAKVPCCAYSYQRCVTSIIKMIVTCQAFILCRSVFKVTLSIATGKSIGRFEKLYVNVICCGPSATWVISPLPGNTDCFLNLSITKVEAWGITKK